MVSEDEFFRVNDTPEAGVDIVPAELTQKLKDNRDDLVSLYAKLIANPYLAPQLVDDFRRNVTNTVATLIEFGIPLEMPKRPRGPEDVLKEGLAELGGMLGAKGFTQAMRVKKSFEDGIVAAQSDEIQVYRDPEDGSYYYIDPETGDEVDCDSEGNPMED